MNTEVCHIFEQMRRDKNEPCHPNLRPLDATSGSRSGKHDLDIEDSAGTEET